MLSKFLPKDAYHIKIDFRTQFTKKMIKSRDDVVYSVAHQEEVARIESFYEKQVRGYDGLLSDSRKELLESQNAETNAMTNAEEIAKKLEDSIKKAREDASKIEKVQNALKKAEAKAKQAEKNEKEAVKALEDMKLKYECAQKIIKRSEKKINLEEILNWNTQQTEKKMKEEKATRTALKMAESYQNELKKLVEEMKGVQVSPSQESQSGSQE
ncbi:hypothetical protein B9Z55_021635 [Caenorhabditis nigoni]|uniref:Uncharacterized protein n=1 Tax=Caenorhabditis nigoni TaxID=1611254 RepID=A0A2G5TSU6_9PELO|nr:hypothetical protein B9Z55_021635 [Caenorhabditis nigoni]